MAARIGASSRALPSSAIARIKSMKQKSTGTNVTALGDADSRSRPSLISDPLPDYPFYAICVRKGGYEPFLEPGQAYKVIRPRKSDGVQHFRVIDAEGEDYLYPQGWFVPLPLRPGQKRRLATALQVD